MKNYTRKKMEIVNYEKEEKNSVGKLITIIILSFFSSFLCGDSERFVH